MKLSVLVIMSTSAVRIRLPDMSLNTPDFSALMLSFAQPFTVMFMVRLETPASFEAVMTAL